MRGAERGCQTNQRSPPLDQRQRIPRLTYRDQLGYRHPIRAPAGESARNRDEFLAHRFGLRRDDEFGTRSYAPLPHGQGRNLVAPGVRAQRAGVVVVARDPITQDAANSRETPRAHARRHELARDATNDHRRHGTPDLALPDVFRLVDEFHIGFEAGQGTTITAAKWCRRR
jgi:hypothetical protein